MKLSDKPDFSHEINYDQSTYYMITETKPRPGWLAKLARLFRLSYGWITEYEVGEGKIEHMKIDPEAGNTSVTILMRKDDSNL